MTPSLEKLSEMVRQVEAKSKAHRLGVETRAAAEALRSAEEKARVAEKALYDERPSRQKELEDCEADEIKLKDLNRKIAQMLSSGDITREMAGEYTVGCEASRVEIDDKRRAALASLETLNRAASDARKALQAAMERYTLSRKELDRLQPALAADFQGDDRLARSAEMLLPAGQIHALAREIDDAQMHFGMLEGREQLAQLTIWIGRYRRLQAMDIPDLSEEDRALLLRLFPRLVGISKQYEPGYIEAFRQGYHTDWDAYVADAEEGMRLATENARRGKDVEIRRRDQQAKDAERKALARESAQTALEELKGVIARYHLPEEGVEEFHSTLARAIAGYGAGDSTILDLVMPYRDLLTGTEFRATRRHLDTLKQEEDRSEDSIRELYADLLPFTKGRRALMIGGSAREDKRRTLERVFLFDELDWEDYEGSRPALLDSLEQRVRNHGVDLILILKAFIAHQVPERLRPLCEQNDIPCLLIEHGYGHSQVAEALRKGLMKTV